MEIAIIVLSIAVLGAVILLVFVFNSNTMNTQAIASLNKEIDLLQEKRISEIKDSLSANQLVTEKLTEAAQMYHNAGQGVVSKIEEAIKVMEGNQYGILTKLNEIKQSIK